MKEVQTPRPWGGKLWPRGQICWLLIFMIKVLLAHSYAHSHAVYGYFLATKSNFVIATEAVIACKT